MSPVPPITTISSFRTFHLWESIATRHGSLPRLAPAEQHGILFV